MSGKLFKELRDRADKFFTDGIKYYEKGNSAAGRRAKAASREIRRLLKEWRLRVIEQEKTVG